MRDDARLARTIADNVGIITSAQARALGISGRVHFLGEVDDETLAYMRLTGRSQEVIDRTERYCKEQGLFYSAETPHPAFCDTLELRFALQVQKNGRFFNLTALEDSLNDFVAVERLVCVFEDV